MNNERREVVEKALNIGRTPAEAFEIALNTPNWLNTHLASGEEGRGVISSFVSYKDARIGNVSGSVFVNWDDLQKMPHTISVSGTRPISFHINLTDYVDSFGSCNGGWKEIVNRYWKQMPPTE